MRNRSLPAAGAALILTLAGVGLAGPASAAPKTAGDPPYGATCGGIGEPACVDSKNGNGNGKAVGRPDAGSVGNADNKNPKGQLPGPQDANNGYECDDNGGIADGNPAHSGCEGGGGGIPS